MVSQNRLESKERLQLKRRERPASTRETSEVVAAVIRLVRTVGNRLAQDDPEALDLLLSIETELDDAWRVAVAGLRETGYSDGAIGAQLGITRQAIEQRWPR